MELSFSLKKEVLPSGTVWSDPEATTLSEMSRPRKTDTARILHF